MSDSNAVIYRPQRRYTEKQRALGYVPLTVWVPEEDREKTIKYAAKLRRDHEKD